MENSLDGKGKLETEPLKDDRSSISVAQKRKGPKGH